MRRREIIAAVGGAAMSWALPAHGQRTGKVYRIAILAANARHLPEFEAFREKLRELGHVEGGNLTLDWRYAEKGADQLPALAAELAALRPDVIVSITTPATQAVKATTSTIPVVFVNIGDPVAAGFVTSLAHPGGNMTGPSILHPQISGKRLELLREVVPSASLAAVIWNPGNLANRLQYEQTREAASSQGVRLLSLEVQRRDEIERAFDTAKRHGVAGVLVVPDPLVGSHRPFVIDLATRSRLPAVYGYREFVEEGGLLAYGPSYPEQYRKAAIYVDRVLNGAKPADLPVEQPTTFELIINLKVAKALGLAIPAALLARADEVIE
jgi:putative ABC transport system substrate-binding protein